jgi:hypothetical protein
MDLPATFKAYQRKEFICQPCNMPRGLTWVGETNDESAFFNTCPLDNMITVAAQHIIEDKNFELNFDPDDKAQEVFLKAIKEASDLSDDPSGGIEAQNTWGYYVVTEHLEKKKDADWEDPNDHSNLFGSVNNRTVQPLIETCHFVKDSICSNTFCEYKIKTSNFYSWFVPENAGHQDEEDTENTQRIDTLIMRDLMDESEEPCTEKSCIRKAEVVMRTVTGIDEPVVVYRPWIHFDNEFAHALPEILMSATDTITTTKGVQFKKKYITLHRGNHYTALLYEKGRWLHYDGQEKGDTKYRYAVASDIANTNASDMFYFREKHREGAIDFHGRQSIDLGFPF